MAQKIEKITAVFNALGDKTRYKIYTLLNNNREICVSEIASEIGISTAGVSQQLQVLERAGLVKRRRMGQRICYEVVDNAQINKQILEIVGGK